MATDSLATLYYSGFEDRGTGTALEKKTRKLPVRSISVSGSRKVESKPNANIGGPVECATLSYENLKISLKGISLRPNTSPEHTFLDWSDILTLYKMKYDGTNAPVLNAKYGGKDLIGTEGSADIKVVLESPDATFDPADSKDAYLPTSSLSFVETA